MNTLKATSHSKLIIQGAQVKNELKAVVCEIAVGDHAAANAADRVLHMVEVYNYIPQLIKSLETSNLYIGQMANPSKESKAHYAETLHLVELLKNQIA